MPIRPNPTYQDGYFKPDYETSVVPEQSFPFSNYPVPDKFSLVNARTYNVQPKLYQPRIANRTTFANFISASDDLTNGFWNYNNAVTVSSGYLGPDGTYNASLIVETGVTNNFYLAALSFISMPAGPAGYGCFLKASGRQFGTLQLVIAGSGIAFANFDLLNGIVCQASIGGTSASASITPVGNGWFWCVVGGIAAASGPATAYIGLSNSSGTVFPSYAGTAGLGAYVFRATIISGSTSGFPPIQTTSAPISVSAPDQETTINTQAQMADPLAFLVAESDPKRVMSECAQVSRHFARIPLPHVTPCTYLFSSPSFPIATSQWASTLAGAPLAAGSVTFIGNNTVPDNNYLVVSSYFAQTTITTPFQTSIINGYYDVGFSCSGGLGGPGPTPGNNFQVGDLLVWSNSSSPPIAWFYGTVSVAGSTPTCTGIVEWAGGATYNTNLLAAAMLPNGYIVRRRIQSTLDQGNVIALPAVVVENYFLPGMTAGIQTAANIPAQNPYSLLAYFQALATRAAGPTIITFSTVGAFSWTVPLGVSMVSVLVVAGGGGGASGGGGGGGLIANTAYPVTPGSVIPITVGGGGTAGNGANIIGGNGGNSSFGDLLAIGGGGGGESTNGTAGANGATGGSGGGAGAAGTAQTGGAGISGQGNSGGTNGGGITYGGGGGGAGAGGSNASGSAAGAGGAGVASSISGSSVTYGGGGGAAPYTSGGSAGGGGAGGGGAGASTGPGTAGTNGLGGGGGGAPGSTTSPGGIGGSGVVIISFVATGYFNVSVDQIASWKGPILLQKYTAAQLSGA